MCVTKFVTLDYVRAIRALLAREAREDLLEEMTFELRSESSGRMILETM